MYIFWLGRVCGCESVTHALVQKKVTTGALERKQREITPEKGNGFAGGGHRQETDSCSLLVLVMQDCVSVIFRRLYQ